MQESTKIFVLAVVFFFVMGVVLVTTSKMGSSDVSIGDDRFVMVFALEDRENDGVVSPKVVESATEALKEGLGESYSAGEMSVRKKGPDSVVVEVASTRDPEALTESLLARLSLCSDIPKDVSITVTCKPVTPSKE